MILEEETFAEFGYYPKDLKLKSGKKILAACDECGKIRTITKHDYRDFCYDCAIHSEETRSKISEKAKGRTLSEETKKKISDGGKGRTVSEETKRKISAAGKRLRVGENHPMFGKHHSEETRKKMSEAQKGENHYNWQGGKSFEPYCHKFNFAFKEYIREKFARVCYLCAKTEEGNGQRLSVHHVNYDKGCMCNDNLTCQFVPLCRSCNLKVNNNREMWEGKIRAKMQNKINGWYI